MRRADIERLLDAVPESELPTVGTFISFVIDQSQRDPMERFLDSCPEDEDMTAEEIEAAELARKEAHDDEEWVSAESLKSELLGH